MSDSVGTKVAEHYAPPGLKEAIASTLAAADKLEGNLSIEDLERFDQFHVLGKDATLRLAERAGVDSTMHVLDVGSGMGGPARFLAQTYGCRVTGVDFAREFLEAAELLTTLTGLADQVSFEQGDALDLPFHDETFDLVWTQHAQQNIADKERFFSELFRVLKRGRRSVMHDLYGGRGVEPTFPAYWGRDPSVSFLITPEETQRLLERVGFEIADWQDTTRETIGWHQGLLELQTTGGDAPEEAGIPGLDYDLMFGTDTVVMTENALTDMKSGAIGIFEAVLVRPA